MTVNFYLPASKEKVISDKQATIFFKPFDPYIVKTHLLCCGFL